MYISWEVMSLESNIIIIDEFFLLQVVKTITYRVIFIFELEINNKLIALGDF